MRRLAQTTLAALALSTVIQAAPALAGDYRLGGVAVQAPWTRPAAAGMNGVGYFTVTNTGPKPITLVTIESSAARSITLHQSLVQNGVSSMRAVSGGVTIAPGAKVAFAPGGYHLMLMGLTKAQVLGGQTPLTLVFTDGRRMKIHLSVKTGPPKAAAADPMAGMAGMHEH
ncbi:copper chaperone PCu(A)C [soil metagenome]